ncbi:phage tail protein [Enterobacter kobei]
MQVGGFGLGLTNLNATSSTNANDILFNGFSSGGGSSSINFFDQYAGLISVTRSGGSDGKGFAGQLQIGGGGALAVRGMGLSTWSSWMQAYTTGNTTKSSDGTLKAASPVARIVASQEACQRADVADDGFSWCGCGTANSEAEGITLSRLDVGVYVLAGSAGLASEGWQLLPPMDPGGMGEMGVVEAEQTENGGLTIRLFKRKYRLSDEGEIVKTRGEPMDVPVNSWIDVRLDMPNDSAFNQRMRQEPQLEPLSPAL